MAFYIKNLVDTPQQNGVVERKHQHHIARALNFQSNIHIKFWEDCVQTVAFIINRTPTPILNNKTPFEILFHKNLDYSLLEFLGVSVLLPLIHQGPKSVFIGYPLGVKSYTLYDVNTKQVFNSSDVFHKHIFPFSQKDCQAQFKSCETSLPLPQHCSYEAIDPFIRHVPVCDSNPVVSPISHTNTPESQESEAHPEQLDSSNSSSSEMSQEDTYDDSNPPTPPLNLRMSNRVSKPPRDHCVLVSLYPKLNPVTSHPLTPVLLFIDI